jgi:predicted transcriptional regulator YdeE
MHITIEVLPDLKLAGLPFVGSASGMQAETPAPWSAFLQRESELGATEDVRYGIKLREQGDIHLDCLAGPVLDLNEIPTGMIGLLLPGRRYAVFTHRGPMTAVPATYVTAFAAMEQLGLHQDSGAWRLERYDRRYTPSVDNPANPDNAYDILIPLRN